jgi:tripartite-type tricarboxylate transporter receptor subunit TctC
MFAAMKIIAGILLAALAGVAFAVPEARALNAVADFYRGKTVVIVIGSTPGGGYDTYARLVARHLGKFIPGHPTVAPTNMPGAGSNAAAAAVYNTLPKDGTHIGAIYASAMLEPLLGDASRIRHDPSKFQTLGSASNEIYTCVVRNDAPIKTMADARAAETILGATAEGGSTVDFPAILNRFFGTKFKIVRGYGGSREVLLAIERNEVHGACGLTWSVLSTQMPDLFTSGRFRMLLQEDMTGIDELNARGIPVAGKLAEDAQARQALELFYAQNVLGRPYVMAPEVPAERVAALRAAFMQVLKDPELLADAKNMRITINPQSGEEVQALIAKLYATPKDVVEAVRSTIAREK